MTVCPHAHPLVLRKLVERHFATLQSFLELTSIWRRFTGSLIDSSAGARTKDEPETFLASSELESVGRVPELLNELSLEGIHPTWLVVEET